MSYSERTHNLHRIEFAAGSDTSQVVDLRSGAIGSFIIPTGSEVITKTIQFMATEGEAFRPPTSKVMPDTAMLATPKTLAAGCNPLTSAEIAEIGSVGYAKLKLNSTVTATTVIFLMWKS
jgi:hypothetical protein